MFETKNAIANGSSEIDMVINIGFLKDGRYEEVEEEIRQIHEACDGKILKVIIETCLLTEEEKIKMCEIDNRSRSRFHQNIYRITQHQEQHLTILLYLRNMLEKM